MAGRRRSAAEWGVLIDELEKSGKELAAFARARGIRPDTLKWWCWRLRSKAKTTPPKSKRTPRVKLLAVRPHAEPAPPVRDEAVPVWELVAPTGHALRVYDRAGLRVLKAALSAVSGGRR